MSKNIIINGKNMKLKYLEGLKVNGNEAVIVRNNYSVMYNKYVIVIQHKDGLLSEYYSDDNEVKKIKLYISYDKPNELSFENPDCNDNWTRIFIYLFDNENSYFLCADSQTISEIGIWNCSVTSREYDAMKQNVLNTAGWIKESLPKRILSIESNEQNESLFIE